MKLSPEEENFLRHWIYDEAHYQEGQGPIRRPAFDAVDFADSRQIKRVCTETIESVRRKGHDFAGEDEPSGVLEHELQARGVDLEDFRH